VSAFFVLVVSATGGLIAARTVFSDRSFVLAGPPMLAAIWAVVAALSIGSGLTLSAVWLPFWSVTGACCLLGLVLIARRPAQLTALIVPTIASLTVMTSYLIHGFAEFPGSWFWDGFAYLAAGDSLWHFPRGGDIDSASLFYQFGHWTVRGRFISAALIGLFKGAFPIGGDAQAAVGYFLLFCVFTFACSAALLARTLLPDHRSAQKWFVTAATVSGSLFNLIWANNFDHLLAFSLAPALLALAFDLNSHPKAFAAGLLTAAEILIYPELCALLILPAALVAIQAALKQPSQRRALGLIAIGALVAVVLIAPLWSDLFGFFKGQVVGVFNSPTDHDRAGSGLFPSLLQWCAPIAAFGLEKPEAVCRISVESFYYMLVSVAGLAVLAAALLRLRNQTALIASCIILAVGVAYFVARRYDYGAYKVAETAWVPMLALGAIAFIRLSGTIRRAIPILAASLMLIGVVRIVVFEYRNGTRTLSEFSVLADVLPKDQITAIRISDSLAFEWASYFLRDHNTVIDAGHLVYFASPSPNVEPSLSRLRSASYLVADRSAPSVAKPVWSNSIYAVYKLNGERPEQPDLATK
jgi:hypothetical protein